MIRSFIALGSNLGDPPTQLRRAEAALAALPQSRLVAVSPWYCNPAIGPGAQPDYLNAVAALDTRLAPTALLDSLQRIEQAQGRERAERWGPRTLDLDILLYGEQTVATPRLQIPHPRLGERAFVLRPLADIAPELVLPGGAVLARLLAICRDTELTPYYARPDSEPSL